MAENSLFYYPYASLKDEQLPLLKVAALYFDKLILLDPVSASWDTIGADRHVRDAVRLLGQADILELTNPATVLAKYESQLTEAIRQDMQDRTFLDLCEAQRRATGKERWTLSLAKVPQDVLTDSAMRRIMGDFARDVSKKAAYATEDYIEDIQALSHLTDQSVPPHLPERARVYQGYAEGGKFFGERREGYEHDVEYRYADFPLALGEAIMINHALFSGLLHADATPLTDEPFHNSVLSLKLGRVAKDKALQQALADRLRSRQLKTDLLAATALSDAQLQLPVLNPEWPLEEVLEYRQQHDAELRRVRERLGAMARRIDADPWSEDFLRELEHQTIPDISDMLDEARKARDAWLSSRRGRLALSAAGIATGAASAVLAIFAAPVTPIALAVAGLSLASGAAVPGLGWMLDWRDGKTAVHENGLHYLLRS